jgi:CheY-like chemotaxis protein
MVMLNESGNPKPYVLYIEDDIEDVELLNFTLENSGAGFSIVHVNNGEEALRLLNDFKPFKPLPSLIMLDVNMPRLDGKETLVCLKADKDIARIPVVVLTTSNDKADVSFFKSYDIPYIVKPGDVVRFKEELFSTLEMVLPAGAFTGRKRKTDAA